MNENNDRIDEMLEQVRAGNMNSTSMNDFDRMAQRAQSDDLSEMAKTYGYSATRTQRNNAPVNNRYEHFMQALDNMMLSTRVSASYRDGFQIALDRYVNKVELNRNNLSIVDKTLRQELIRVGKNGSNTSQMPFDLTSPIARRGYYQGLKWVEEALDQSKVAMMKRVSAAVLKALEK